MASMNMTKAKVILLKKGIRMITIKNLRNEKPSEEWDVKVDRSSVLGNPFSMNHDERKRDTVCDLYQTYFDETLRLCPIEIQDCAKFTVELARLLNLYRVHGCLNLFCWCAPKRCHAETIRDYILEITKND
jgi:hypothetical protein